MSEDPLRPRYLTEEEIKDILDVVPHVKSAATEVGDYNRSAMLRTLREQLKMMMVTPLGIADIKHEVLRQFNDSIIKPGTVVGVNAAEAIGRPITQGALNSFHQSGSSKNVTYGVDRFRELLNASENIKRPSCSIFFNDQSLSKDEIITKVRPVIVEISVRDIVKGVPDIPSYDDIEEPWWYQPYKLLIRDDFRSRYVLTLEMDVNLMYAHKITMEDVARVIQQDQPVICVYSPMNIGEMHIYPVESSIRAKIKEGSINPNEASMIFIHRVVIPALDKLKITGVEGIQQIYPVDAPVWQIVKEEQRSSSIENGWFLILNELRMTITGISVEKLVNLCQTSGMVVSKVRPNYILVQTPNGEKPGELVMGLLDQDKKETKAYEEAKRKEGALIVRRPPTEFSKAAFLVYADSDGSAFKGSTSTLRSLLGNSGIDSTRTYCNNVHEISSVLGVEAARSFLIKEIGDAVEYEGTYIDPRHIVLLVDFMVSLGRVSGLTFTGISRQPLGALEKATVQKAMDVFKEASGFGENKPVKGVSASIYVGKKALIGTGYDEQFMDRSKFKDIEEEIVTNPDMKLDIGAFKDAIADMDDLAFGTDLSIMEGFEDEMFAGEDPLASVAQVMPKPGNLVPDPRVYESTKGPLVRAPELSVAAVRLGQPPCLPSEGPTEVSVGAIKDPVPMEQLPFYVPEGETLELSQPDPNKTFTPTLLGLPSDLVTEMEKAQSIVQVVPVPPKPVGIGPPKPVGIKPLGPPSALKPLGPPKPLGTLAPVPKPIEKPKEPEKPKAQIMDLDLFLG